MNTTRREEQMLLVVVFVSRNAKRKQGSGVFVSFSHSKLTFEKIYGVKPQEPNNGNLPLNCYFTALYCFLTIFMSDYDVNVVK